MLKKWACKSTYNKNGIHLGHFLNEIDAAIMYDKFVLFHFGKDARTNNLVTYDDIKNLTIEDFIKKKKLNNCLNIFSKKIKMLNHFAQV